MLLLPLLLFWVKAPMRFSKRMLRAVISSVFMIALLGPLVTVTQAEQPHEPAPAVFSFGVETDTSEHDQFFADAERVEDIFDEADREPLMASDIIEVPPRFPDRYSAKADPQPSDGDADSGSSLRSDTRLSRSESESAAGAYVPPTRGRFVLREGRWSFVPEDPRSAVVVRETEADTTVLENTFRAASAVKNLRAQTQAAIELVPSNPLRNGESDREQLLGQLGKTEQVAVMSSMKLSQLVVSENLMLERVVESIRLDKANDLWLVSGYITEVFGENRIELRTARSLAK